MPAYMDLRAGAPGGLVGVSRGRGQGPPVAAGRKAWLWLGCEAGAQSLGDTGVRLCCRQTDASRLTNTGRGGSLRRARVKEAGRL
eukprot:scaffold10460_cov90-Isochrysis_galbana.AAC.3